MNPLGTSTSESRAKMAGVRSTDVRPFVATHRVRHCLAPHSKATANSLQKVHGRPLKSRSGPLCSSNRCACKCASAARLVRP